jgi:hypothetical protein
MARSSYQSDDGYQWSWRTFTPARSHADEGQFLATCDAISKQIIEQDYQQSHTARDTLVHGRVVVKRPNHGTAHAARQASYAAMLLDRIEAAGAGRSQAIARQINSDPEIRNAIRLAAFCKRIGRVSDTEKSHSQPTSYSKRSADMFARIARERGYDAQLVAIIRESMLEPASAQKRQQLGPYKGLSGADLCGVSSSVLMAAHKADLVRIFSVNKQLIHNELRSHFAPGQLQGVTNDLVDVACQANLATGNGLHAQQGHRYAAARYAPARLAAVTHNPVVAMQRLAGVVNPPAAPAATAARSARVAPMPVVAAGLLQAARAPAVSGQSTIHALSRPINLTRPNGRGQAHRLTHVEVTGAGYVFHGATFNNNKAYIRTDLQGNILSRRNSNPNSWVATMGVHLRRPGEFQRLVDPYVQQQQLQQAQMPQQAGPAWAQSHQPPRGVVVQSTPGFSNGVEYQLHPKPADTDIINNICNHGNGTWTIEGESSIGNKRSITINTQGQCIGESHQGSEFCKWMAQNTNTILTDYAKANPDQPLPMRGRIMSHNQAQHARAEAIAASIPAKRF